MSPSLAAATFRVGSSARDRQLNRTRRFSARESVPADTGPALSLSPGGPTDSDISKFSFHLNTETEGEMSEFALFLLKRAALYDHVVAMGLELRRLTKGADMRFLTYLLE